MPRIAHKERLTLKLLAILLAFSLVPLVMMGILSIMKMNDASDAIQNKITGLNTTLNRSALTVASTETDQLQLAMAKANQYDEFFSRIKMENELVTRYATLESESENCSIPNGIWISPGDQNPASSETRASTIKTLCLPAKIMQSISEVEPAAALSFIGTSNGVLITWPNDNDTIARTTPFDYLDRPYYSAAKILGSSSWTGPYRDKNDELKITYVSPIKRKKEFFGIMGMDVYLEPLYRDISSIGGRGYPFVINDSGSIILRPMELPGGSMNDLFASDSLAEINNSEVQHLLSKLHEDNPISAIVSLQDIDTYIALAPIQSMNWKLGFIFPVEEMSLPARFVDEGVEAAALGAIKDLKDATYITKVLFGLLIILNICIIVVASLFIGSRVGFQINSSDNTVNNTLNEKSGMQLKSSSEQAQFNDTNHKTISNHENRFFKPNNEINRRSDLKNKNNVLYEMKKRLTPDYLPKQDGYEIAILHLPSLGADFDIFDVHEVGNKLALSMASVGGEGLQSAILAIMAKSLILASSEESDPSKVIADLNSGIIKHSSGMHLTCFYALLDPSSNFLEYANAGFNPPFIVDSGGIIDTLGDSDFGGGGIALGMLERIDLKTVRIPLQEHDVMVIYSNGLTEMINGQKKFGINHLINIIKANREMTAPEIKLALERNIREYLGNISTKKDATMMILKRIHYE